MLSFFMVFRGKFVRADELIAVTEQFISLRIKAEDRIAYEAERLYALQKNRSSRP